MIVILMIILSHKYDRFLSFYHMHRGVLQSMDSNALVSTNSHQVVADFLEGE